jgi:hypothetical protein
MKRIIAISVSWALLSGVPAANADENAIAFQTVSGEFQQPDPVLDYARQNARPASEPNVTPVLSQEAPVEEPPVAPEPPAAPEEEMADVAPPTADEAEAPAEEAAAAEEADECGAGKDECGCDKKKIEAAKKAAATAYKPLYYDNDFSYIDDPCYKGCLLGDNFKQMHLGDCWVVSVGGEFRMRQHTEHNLRGKPLSGRDDDFLLYRTRLFANAKYGDWLRLYAEAIDAQSEHENLQPRNIEVNRADMLNLFADVRALDGDNADVWVRGGRQELLYGNQRLISPLDWSNTRRTFDGLKGMYKAEKLSADVFWTRNVPFSQHLPDDHNFDNPNQSEEFMGAYATYKKDANQTLETFFLRLDEQDPVTQPSGTVVNGYDPNLFGARWYFINGDWLHEVEGGYQFGDYDRNQDIQAGYYVIGLGREMKCVKTKPTVWLYYDWASGDADPTDLDYGTFNQYFPLGHKYFGFMDIIARQNIQDINASSLFHLHEKITLLAWYHVFFLEEERDALYNAAGVPIYQDPTGGAGKDIGQEIDLLLTYKFNPRADIVLGYSHFFAGDYFDSAVIQNGPAGLATNGSNGQDADFLYTQLSVQF